MPTTSYSPDRFWDGYDYATTHPTEVAAHVRLLNGPLMKRVRGKSVTFAQVRHEFATIVGIETTHQSVATRWLTYSGIDPR